MQKFLIGIFLLMGVRPVLAQKAEAENGMLIGTQTESSRAGYSGNGYVTGFDQDGDALTMNLEVSRSGLYNLRIGYAAPFGEKTNDVYVNAAFSGSHVFPFTNSFTETLFGKVFLQQGPNEITIVKSWGFFEVDYVSVTPAVRNEIHHYSEDLIHPDASFEAVTLYQFIRDYYGHHIISGQQSFNGTNLELDYLMEHTGKWPAIKGFDLIDYSPSRVEFGTTSEETDFAIDWWDLGGIVSLMWHWNAPKDLLDTEDAPWWSGFYTYATTFDHTIAMNDENSEEYELIIRDIDSIAVQLKLLDAANVPLLWRPLHEAEGGWFWWGSRGSEACVWLWQLMYERLTTYHGLDNLIWVWTGTSSPDAMDWYPGDDYVDLIGADTYFGEEVVDYPTSLTLFDNMAGIHQGKKVLTLSETGRIPDADHLLEEKARWSWFCLWSGDFILDGMQNEIDHVNMVYNHEYVITYDELPDFYNYVSPDFPDEEVEEPAPLSAAPAAFYSVYPNPTADYLTITFAEPARVELVTLHNVKGERVEYLVKEEIDQQKILDLNGLADGLYILQVFTAGGVERLKIRKN